MTTLRQLNSIAKHDLNPFLRKNGFKTINILDFNRKNKDEIFNIIFFNINYGANLTVTVACHTKEMDPLCAHPYPKDFCDIIGSALKPNRDIQLGNSHLWEVETMEKAEVAITEIKTAIIEYALPFFESMKTREDMINYLHPAAHKDDHMVPIIKAMREYQPE